MSQYSKMCRTMCCVLAAMSCVHNSVNCLWAQEATLYRDTWGVPHVYSESEAAAMYALGYAQAEDRLADIYLAIRTAIGRMAEVTGKSMVDQDYMMRLVGNDSIHEAFLEQASDAMKANLNAFVAGIQSYIDQHPGEAADVAIDIQPWHPLAVGRAMILRWPIGTVMDDLKRGKDPVKPGMGSNQWAVSPSRSADGSAILMSDPHLTWEGLAVLYEARFHGGDLHMNGYYLIGSPMMGIGHNQHVGWALTTGGPDTSDIYRIKFRLVPQPQYLYDDQWKPITMKTFKIPVKDGPPVTRPAFYTHLGPVVSEPDMAAGTAFVGASPYFEQTGLYQQFYDMARVRDVHEFNQVLSAHQYNEQNVMSADVLGNISYVRNGATPIRPAGYDWSRPVDGTTSATAWKGIHPQSDLVHIINPPQGYMQNCNISPQFMMVDSPMHPDKYPPYIYNVSWDLNNPRGKRTVDLLHHDASITVEDAQNITLDVYDILAHRWQLELKAALSECGQDFQSDSEFQAAVAALLAWDGHYTPEATASVLYKFWRLKCGEQIDLSPLGQEQALPTESRKQALSLLKLTINQLKEQYGRWDIPWGQVHVVGRGGQYFPVGGADYSAGDKEANFSETLFDVRSEPDKLQPGRFIANSGSMAMITMFFDKNGVRSYTCTPWGQSAHENSPHYMDQGEHLYSKRKMKPTWWNKADLLEHVESTKTFQLPTSAK
ncbi:MAG: penicillin acylase family protein [Pirellulaceae bacterium]|nr:penicillin acylase family protein [Pirellulaceae bacterium]